MSTVLQNADLHNGGPTESGCWQADIDPAAVVLDNRSSNRGAERRRTALKLYDECEPGAAKWGKVLTVTKPPAVGESQQAPDRSGRGRACLAVHGNRPGKRLR